MMTKLACFTHTGFLTVFTRDVDPALAGETQSTTSGTLVDMYQGGNTDASPPGHESGLEINLWH